MRSKEKEVIELALLGPNKTLKGLFNTGMVGDALKSLGIKTGINYVDKRFLGGKLTSTGLSIGKSLNGKPLSLNATDLIFALGTTGVTTSSSKLVPLAVNFAVVKSAEAFDVIDPPTVGLPEGWTNITARRAVEQAKKELIEQQAIDTIPTVPAMATHATFPAFGGNY